MLLLASCAGRHEAEEPPDASPGLEARGDTYAEARARFRTHLLRAGPATPDAVPPPIPAGADSVTYRSGDRELRAYASPPAKDGHSRPAVLFLHGGFGLAPAHWDLARPFRDAGYVVVIPSLRGEDGQPGDFTLFWDEVDDVLAAAEALAARPDVEPGRLFIAGHSVGGTLALLGAMASGRFRAAASFSGSPDQVEYTRGRADRIPFDPKDPEEFRVRSPVAFPTSLRCPTRLYFGDEEFWLQPATRRLAILAGRAGLDVQAVEVPGGHDSAVAESMARCLRFFGSR